MRSAHMMRQIAASDMNVRDLNPRFVRQTICADYCLDGVAAYGHVLQLRRHHGQIEASC